MRTVLRARSAFLDSCVHIVCHMMPVQLLSQGVVQYAFTRVIGRKGNNEKGEGRGGLGRQAGLALMRRLKEKL